MTALREYIKSMRDCGMGGDAGVLELAADRIESLETQLDAATLELDELKEHYFAAQKRGLPTTVRHPDRLGEQVNRILANRGSWDQKTCHSACGTKHSIAGHGQIAAGKPMDDDTCRADAREWYGLTDDCATWLFNCYRTLIDLYEFATVALAGEPYFGDDGFDRNGFNCKGYGSDGYHRSGYDRQGFDRYGFDRQGFNRYGFDRDGYHRVGCLSYGFNRYGSNRDGFNRAGFNRNGYNRDGGSMPLLKIAAGGTP